MTYNVFGGTLNLFSICRHVESEYVYCLKILMYSLFFASVEVCCNVRMVRFSLQLAGFHV